MHGELAVFGHHDFGPADIDRREARSINIANSFSV
jgi:hypothetical protein